MLSWVNSVYFGHVHVLSAIPNNRMQIAALRIWGKKLPLAWCKSLPRANRRWLESSWLEDNNYVQLHSARETEIQ